ncbi:MAG: 1-hydroxy-2-methyl-2-butenyl 4-diphosphate reductase [Streptomycetaceae bacterium]|nr:1-hydroxy-2-methyl-2-butenyl 4-diphosphate reductase [Streptomycetaceae bacterium]
MAKPLAEPAGRPRTVISTPAAAAGALRPERDGRPLLIVCALSIEHLALRGGANQGSCPVALLRTGMGARAAERAVGRVLRGDPRLREAAVLATGFCAGLAPGLRPGDIVVDERGPGCETLVDAFTLLGQRVHTGPIAHSDHVVRGAERFRLRAEGAAAVDMETAAVRRAALASGPRPVTAVRVVVDTPEYELLRVATLRTGITAFHVLRSVLPAFLEWHRSIALPRR